MLNIFHMPPSEAMLLYWGLCKVSYREGIFLGNFTTFDCFEDNLERFWLKINQKKTFTVTDFAHPPIKLHSF